MTGSWFHKLLALAQMHRLSKAEAGLTMSSCLPPTPLLVWCLKSCYIYDPFFYCQIIKVKIRA